jgi:hypothetical protein
MKKERKGRLEIENEEKVTQEVNEAADRTDKETSK